MSEPTMIVRPAPSSQSRGIGQIGAEVRECVLERGCVAVVVLLALGEREELRELGAAPVVGRRGEGAGVEGRDREEERPQRGDYAEPRDRDGGEPRGRDRVRSSHKTSATRRSLPGPTRTRG